MGRILAIDYGQKRVGIAVTDELKMIATALTTVHSKDIYKFLQEYTAKENVECIVVGEPKRFNNQPSEVERLIKPFVNKIRKMFKDIPVERFDERFTSKMASQTLVDAGYKKKDRQKKELVDSISATIILQSYMEANPQI